MDFTPNVVAQHVLCNDTVLPMVQSNDKDK